MQAYLSFVEKQEIYEELSYNLYKNLGHLSIFHNLV